MNPLASCLGLWLLCQLPALASGTRVIYKVQEEQPPNSLIGSLASDYGLPDMGHLYKLEVGAPYLRVDGKTGDIYTTETSIDRENLRECQHLLPGDPCYLEFEVSITNLNANSSPRLLEGQIEVLDINDNTPNFASPVLTLSIPENTNIGTLFPIPMAMDRDSGPNGVASYELMAGPEAQQLFGLQVAEDQDEKQPQLIVMGNLDREQWDSYDLTIKVQDGGNPPRASSALLRITILDMNDNAPKFEKALYEAELSENSPVGHSVLQVSVGGSSHCFPSCLAAGTAQEPWFLQGGGRVGWRSPQCHPGPAGRSQGCHICSSEVGVHVQEGTAGVGLQDVAEGAAKSRVLGYWEGWDLRATGILAWGQRGLSAARRQDIEPFISCIPLAAPWKLGRWGQGASLLPMCRAGHGSGGALLSAASGGSVHCGQRCKLARRAQRVGSWWIWLGGGIEMIVVDICLSAAAILISGARPALICLLILM